MSRVVLLALPLLAAMPAIAQAGTIFGSSKARECFEAAVHSQPKHNAVKACNSALRDDELVGPDRAATLVNRGIVNMQARRLDAAIADYDAAIALNPDSAEAWINKGIALTRIGNRDDEAVKALSEGIALGPRQLAVAYYSRGVAYEALGRARQAYEDYSRAAQLDPAWSEPAEQLQRFQVVRGKSLNG